MQPWLYLFQVTQAHTIISNVSVLMGGRAQRRMPTTVIGLFQGLHLLALVQASFSKVRTQYPITNFSWILLLTCWNWDHESWKGLFSFFVPSERFQNSFIKHYFVFSHRILGLAKLLSYFTQRMAEIIQKQINQY